MCLSFVEWILYLGSKPNIQEVAQLISEGSFCCFGRCVAIGAVDLLFGLFLHVIYARRVFQGSWYCTNARGCCSQGCVCISVLDVNAL